MISKFGLERHDVGVYVSVELTRSNSTHSVIRHGIGILQPLIALTCPGLVSLGTAYNPSRLHAERLYGVTLMGPEMRMKGYRLLSARLITLQPRSQRPSQQRLR